MTKVSEMSNEQLCEAISTIREPEIRGHVYFELGELSPNKNWNFGQNRWYPIQWLLPEDWTRLLEEISPCEIIHHSNKKYTVRVVQPYLPIKTLSDNCGRAVCEAYAIAFGGGKYE